MPKGAARAVLVMKRLLDEGLACLGAQIGSLADHDPGATSRAAEDRGISGKGKTFLRYRQWSNPTGCPATRTPPSASRIRAGGVGAVAARSCRPPAMHLQTAHPIQAAARPSPVAATTPSS